MCTYSLFIYCIKHGSPWDFWHFLIFYILYILYILYIYFTFWSYQFWIFHTGFASPNENTFGHHWLHPCYHRLIKPISVFPKIRSYSYKLKPHSWSNKSFCRYQEWMPGVHQQHDGFSIFDEDIAGDYVEMESHDKEAQCSSERRMHGKREKTRQEGGGGWLIEQVKYTEREEGCLLMLPANGERQ